MKKEKKKFFSNLIDGFFNTIQSVFNYQQINFSNILLKLITSFKDFKYRASNLVKSNLEVAEIHVVNKNFFDAKMRYKFVLFLDKQNFTALCGLGFIYSYYENHTKAEFYFKKAIENSSSLEEKEEAKGYLYEITNSKS